MLTIEYYEVYSVCVEALQEKAEKGTPNDEYENFVEAHLEAQQSVFQQNLELNIEPLGKR